MRERSVLKTAQATMVLASALGLGACGGDSKSGNGTDASASTAANGSGESTASDGSGGTSTSAASSTTTTGSTTAGGADDLSGTWDVIVSRPDGSASASTVTLSPTQLRVTGELEVLALIASEVMDIVYEGESARATRQAEGTLDLGVLPLPMAGLLRFEGVPADAKGCDYALGPDALTLVCSSGISTPNHLPKLANANLSALRTQALDSIFGDLGGEWSVTATDLDCVVVFEDNTIAVDCARVGSDSGQLDITVDSGRVSGLTSGGLEFTAQRR